MVEPAQLADLAWAVKSLAERRAAYRLLADYYAGNHRLAFATEKWRNAFGQLFKEYRENLCPAVVDAVSDRLRLEGFGVEGGPKELAAEAWALWQAARMDRRSGELHTEALTSGDAYLIVWPDADGAPAFHVNDAEQVTVAYDRERPDAVTRAAKAWIEDDGTACLTLYYGDRIEKYASTRPTRGSLPDRASAFAERPVEGEPWPLPNRYGAVPVFHFATNARSGRFGRSELADVLPIQDALNKSVCDLLVAGEYVALPQRYVIGLDAPERDPATGEVQAPFRPGVDRIWYMENENAKFGEFAQADLGQFLAAQDSFALRIARVSRTPLHYIQPQNGNPPSGEALRTAEAPFLAKVADRQASFGNVWEDALRFALQIAGRSVEGLRLSALWRDPTPRGELEHAQALAEKRTLGVSEMQALREMGYSAEQITAMQGERAREPQPAQPAQPSANGAAT